MFRLPWSIGPLVALPLGLAACDLPQGVGIQAQVLKGADDPDATFSVQNVTRDNLPALKSWPITSPAATQGWITNSAGPASQIIEAGELIEVTIRDNEVGSLLGATGQKIISLPKLTVTPAGTVFLPYADEVYVAKMTPDEARQAIQDKLLAIVPSAQVLLSHQTGRKSSVDLVSGEAQIAFTNDNLTALDAMSLAGGLNDASANPKGILILRDYSAKAVRSDGSGPDRERMIFALDLTTADGLFSAGEFAIQHRDLVLVTESPITNARTVIGLIASSLGLASSAGKL